MLWTDTTQNNANFTHTQQLSAIALQVASDQNNIIFVSVKLSWHAGGKKDFQ